MLLRVLLAVEPPSLATRVRRLVEGPEVAVSTVRARSLWARLPREDVDVVVLSRGVLPEPVAPAIASIRDLPEHPEVFVLSEAEDAESRAALLAAGCMAVFYQGLPDSALAETLQALLRRSRDEALRRLRDPATERRTGLDGLVQKSPTMQQFLSLARRVVASDSSILLLGETGVGKERLARALHSDGLRGGGPFIPVNCAALPESLLESELFGHEQGAFTGASRQRRGYFEIAHGGTLFLDEIGDLPAHVQVKLLRVLQERTIQRVGGERPIGVNVRVMAATNRDLDAEVHARRFRPDLYYRLAVVTLTIPPLRERREDIPALVDAYLEHFRTRLGRPVRRVSGEAQSALESHSWPGNVRELVNVIERAVLLCAGHEVGVDDLPPSIVGDARPRVPGLSAALPAGDDWLDRPLKDVREAAMAEVERAYLSALLRVHHGRIGTSARHAGLNERSLYALMKRHGLRKESFKRHSPSNRK
jgi:two-component system response regulator AtoC